MRAPLAFVALALAGACGASEGRAAPCNVHGSWSFPRKANLPRGAEAALGFEMAELGGQWNATDVLDPRHPLPSARFIAARQRDCRLEIDYEQGGIAHFNTQAVLRWTEGRWLLERRGGSEVVK